MPWRGPSEPGEFPTLGYEIGEWIEAHVVIPDGYRRGEQYRLTDEMWRFLLRFYRVDAEEGRLHFYGGQLRRSQKWGKLKTRSAGRSSSRKRWDLPGSTGGMPAASR